MGLDPFGPPGEVWGSAKGENSLDFAGAEECLRGFDGPWRGFRFRGFRGVCGVSWGLMAEASFQGVIGPEILLTSIGRGPRADDKFVKREEMPLQSNGGGSKAKRPSECLPHPPSLSKLPGALQSGSPKLALDP